jgi:hypothetical protein
MNCLVVVLAALLLALPPQVALAEEPPPTPTLAPVTGFTPTATQTHQLQYFARQAAYGVHPSTVITNTTSSGSVWLLERRFTYGEAAIVVLLMAVALLLTLDLMLRLGTVRL